MIGEAAFGEVPVGSGRQWLAIAYAGTTARAESSYRILAATAEFATPYNDVFPNIPFAGTLRRALRLDRSIVTASGFGRMSQSVGEIELINTAGDYDETIDRFTIDGRRVVIKVGRVDRPYATFRTLFDGTATGWHADRDVLRVPLRDNGYKLEVPASPSLYAGAGGLDGGDDLSGKRKPLTFGTVSNISPPLVIPSELLYQVHDGPVQAISAVYDRASGLAFQEDHASSALLRSASVLAGRYSTCLAEGHFRLGAAPVGTVTADVEGDKTGGIFASTTAAIVRRLLSRASSVQDPGG